MTEHVPLDLVSIKAPEQAVTVDSQMIQTMMFVTLSGFVMSMIYYVCNFVYDNIRRRLVCSITINGTDDIFKMLINYLT